MCVAFEVSACSGSEEVVCAGSLFFATIVGRDFVDKPGSKEEDVDISVLQNGGRSLSPWLTMERAGKGASTSVVLYGTPDFADIGILSLEVWSVLKGRSRKLVKTLEITVTQPPGRIYTAVRFPVIGATVYDLFQSGKIYAFESWSKSMFGTKGVLVRVTPLHDTRGFEVTISPGHGVLRLPGSAREKVDEMIGHCQRQGKESRFKAGELFIAAGLDIDWCNVQQLIEEGQGPLHSLRRRSTLGSQTTAAAGNDSFITLPSYEGSHTPLVVIVIVTATTVVLVTTALAWVFFGGRRKGFYISHKRTIEQRILHNKEKQIISKVAEAQRVLMDLNQPKESLSSDQMVAQPNVDEITGDRVSIQSLPAEPLPPYVYPRGLLQYTSTVTFV